MPMNIAGSFNWIDLCIAALWVFFAFEGWRAGSIQLLSGLIAYAGSLWVSLRYHGYISVILVEKAGASQVWSDILGYILTAFISHLLLSYLLLAFFRKIGRHLIGTRFDSVAGVVISLFNISAILAFILFLLLKLPIRGDYKKDISRSFLAPRLVRLLDVYGEEVAETLDAVASEATKFLTVNPDSREIIQLDIKPQSWELSVDTEAERKLTELLNSERIKSGKVPLSTDTRLVQVARDHSRDMIMRQYFSHYDPDGNDVAFRLKKAGIGFEAAGENLAFAPDIEVAHRGLMSSEGHRRNIMDSSYAHVGVGVIDAGVYGKMITQIFMGSRFFIFNSP